MSNKRAEAILLAAERLQHLQRALDFNPDIPGSRPTAQQQQVFDDLYANKHKIFAITGGNRSGKSAIGRRILATMLREDPESGWKRPKNWKGPLLFAFVGQNHKQMVDDFMRQFSKYFGEDELHIVKQSGNALVSATFKANGNKITFFVHGNVAECRENIQALQLHAYFLDELPHGVGSARLIEEINARIVDMKGYGFLTFTPKSVNREIRDFVESLKAPLGKKYSLHFLDNPSMDEESKQIRLAQMAGLSKEYQKTLLEGAWMTAENAVYIVPDAAIATPEGYSPAWRHVVSVDPGLDSKCGVVVLTECPHTHRWYVVKETTLDSLKDVDATVTQCISFVKGLNVVRWIYDPASTWWLYTARKYGIKNIVCPHDKNNRKDEMIANLQEAIATRLFFAPWCDLTIDELRTAHWSVTAENKIANGKSLHLHDAIRYGLDCLPKPEFVPTRQAPWWEELRRKHAEQVEREYKEQSGQCGVPNRLPSRRNSLSIVRMKRKW